MGAVGRAKALADRLQQVLDEQPGVQTLALSRADVAQLQQTLQAVFDERKPRQGRSDGD